MEITREALFGFMAGNGTVGTTAAPLTQQSFQIWKHVVIRASASNTGVIIVGDGAARAAAGFILAKGEQTPPIYVDDTSKVWLVGGAAGQAYNWIAT